MFNIIYAGIDVSSKNNVVCLLDNSGKEITKRFSIPNNLSGAKELEAKLLSLLSSNAYSSVKIGMESTAFYDWHLANFLVNSSVLAPFKPSVFRINARLVHNFKKSYPESDETDITDSFVIADYLRFNRLPAPFEAEQPYLPLRRLTRYRFHLVKIIIREHQYFLAHLFLKFSSFAQDKPAGKTSSATSIALISELTPDEIADMHPEALTDFIMKHGKSRFSNPSAIVDAVSKAARESYRIRPELANSVNIILSSTIETIRTLKKSLKLIDEAIAKEFDAFPNTLQSVNGIGPVYAAGIFSEIGDIKRFNNDEEKIAKYAGLSWKRNQSGNFEAEETRLIRSANKYLRYYLIEAANTLRIHNVDYKLFYQKKFKEVPKHQHKRALVLSARKLVRLVFALLSKGQLYQPGFKSQFVVDHTSHQQG